jgi:GntR family transcriptional regulator
MQVKDHLLSEIQSGKWKDNELIPTNDELCAQYAVSAITVREAVKILVREGYLERIQGKGTFVRAVKYSPHLAHLFSFTKWAKEKGLQPSTRIIHIDLHLQNAALAYELGISPPAELTRIERLRLGDDEPLCLEQISLASETCPDIHLKDPATRPFNDILTNDYGIKLIKSTVAIKPALASPYEAKLLRMKAGDVMQVFTHKVFARRNKVAYIVRCVYRSDKVIFEIEL